MTIDINSVTRINVNVVIAARTYCQYAIAIKTLTSGQISQPEFPRQHPLRWRVPLGMLLVSTPMEVRSR